MEAKSSQRGQVLVCIINTLRDMNILREQLWYRIPVDKAPKRWPPKYLAFYQTKVFGHEAYAVRYFGKVVEIKRATRAQLVPSEPYHKRANREYYQLLIDKLHVLPRPVKSNRLRRIVFIPTTYQKLRSSTEINDLFDDSPLEDALWTKLKQLNMSAERQWFLETKDANHFLDFALFCNKGNIDVETDGDRWHNLPHQWLGLGQAVGGLKQLGQVVEAGGNSRMVGTMRRLVNRQRTAY